MRSLFSWHSKGKLQPSDNQTENRNVNVVGSVEKEEDTSHPEQSNLSDFVKDCKEICDVHSEVGKAFSADLKSGESKGAEVPIQAHDATKAEACKVDAFEPEEDLKGKFPASHQDASASGNSSAVFDCNLLLCRAAFLNRLDVIAVCFQKNAELTFRDSSGRTALHSAAAGGSVGATEAILNHAKSSLGEETIAAIVNCCDPKGWTPLHLAVCRSFVDVAKVLLENNASASAALTHAVAPCRSGPTKSFPIHFAAIKGCQQMFDCLLDFNIDVNSRDDSQRTPLHYAAYRPNPSFVEFLLKRGASVDALDVHRRSPLHVAALGGKKENVEILIAAGAELFVKDIWDMKPFHLAHICRHKSVVLAMASTMSFEQRDAVKEQLSLHEQFADTGEGARDNKIETEMASLQLEMEREMDCLDSTVVSTLITGLKEAKRGKVVRAVKRLGATFCLKVYTETLDIEAAGGVKTADASRNKLAGGIFFGLLKDKLNSLDKMDDWRYINQEDKEQQKAFALKLRAQRRAIQSRPRQMATTTQSVRGKRGRISASVDNPNSKRRERHDGNNGQNSNDNNGKASVENCRSRRGLGHVQRTFRSSSPRHCNWQHQPEQQCGVRQFSEQKRRHPYRHQPHLPHRPHVQFHDSQFQPHHSFHSHLSHRGTAASFHKRRQPKSFAQHRGSGHGCEHRLGEHLNE